MAKKQFRCFGVIVNDDSERYAAEDVTPAQFANFLKFCDPTDEIEMMINSPGGSVTAGLAIANMIKSAKQPITARVYGIAASMASVIACAAPSLAIYKSAFMMVHNPWTVMMGDSAALKKEAAVLDSMKAACIGFYQSKFPTIKAEDLAKLMDEETWMLGSEAQTYGLAAAIEDDVAVAAACVKGPAQFGKMPEAAKRFYSADPALPHLAPPAASAAPDGSAAAAASAAPSAPSGSGSAPDVVALSQRAEQLAASLAAAEALSATQAARLTALEAELAASKESLAKAEAQRRDHQSKSDRLDADLKQLRTDTAAAASSAAAKISALTAEKDALNSRLAAVTLNALQLPSNACAQTWDEALAECGSYESAKTKYPHLAEAYRLAHSTGQA